MKIRIHRGALVVAAVAGFAFLVHSFMNQYFTMISVTESCLCC